MRLTVVSPFLDRQHGTEMCIVEQIERLAREKRWSIELYSQKVSDLDGVQRARNGTQTGPGEIRWHRVPDIPGPHLLKFAWWFLANHWRRWRDQRSGRVQSDLVYTPGTNCLDADVIMVQIVFHAFYEEARGQLLLRRVPVRTWPRLIHRLVYYHLIMFLERKIYRNPRVTLIAVSRLIARQLESFLGREDVVVIPNTVDVKRFSPEVRRQRRTGLRELWGVRENEFVILMVGNDWKKKGLDTLLKALSRLSNSRLRLIVVGKDDVELYRPMLEKLGLQERVSFKQPASDVVQFYSAADLYAGPSLEDGFNLPILEAMACGLPVIASIQTGASENIIDGETGLILFEPQNDELLAGLIRRLYEDDGLRVNMGQAAAEFTRANGSWDRNTDQTLQCLERVYNSRRENSTHPSGVLSV
jgi:glycosyltransferase involved in cell wall biosynthesis